MVKHFVVVKPQQFNVSKALLRSSVVLDGKSHANPKILPRFWRLSSLYFIYYSSP